MADKELNGTSSHDHAAAGRNGHAQQRKPYDYGGNPLAHINTGDSVRLAAFGGEFQPGLYRSTENRKFANPAPLGLSAFALTTFLLSLINMGAEGLSVPSVVIGPAFAYGGLCQLLAGMWDIAVGNTFGGTALSSYGGFWIGTAIILTPGGFQVEDSYPTSVSFEKAFGIYLLGWFIFTFILLICTLRSTVAFFLLFFTLDMAFLLLGIAYIVADTAGVNTSCLRAGGAFACLAAFLAWYNALAGIADTSNSFFLIPVAHFPWSDKGRERREKVDNSEARAEQGQSATGTFSADNVA